MNNTFEKQFLDGLELNKDRLFRLCLSYASDEAEAKDLFQESLFTIWKSMDSFKGNAAIGTWMFRITINTCLRNQSLQKKSSKIVKPLDGLGIEFPIQNQTDNDYSEELVQFQKCIQTLPKADKALITLYLEELPYKEIAIITGLTENHIAVKIKRIKKKLLEFMEKSL